MEKEIQKFDEVFHYDWYDGPISGVANRNGKPYFFEYQKYNEINKESYYLTPIKEEILQLAIEDWQIWKRWDTAFHKGEVKIDTHPYLPEERKRGKELKEKLEKVLKIDKSNYIELDAEFRIKGNQENVLGMKKLIVKW